MDINIILRKLDRLQELVWNEPVDSSDILAEGRVLDKIEDYFEGMIYGLNVAIDLLEKERELKREV